MQMIDGTLATAMLDSLKDPFLFADTDHVIRYMNRAAAAHYEEGEALLGRSLLDCHNAQSQRVIHEVLSALQAGEEERLITDNEKHRIHMRAVRAPNGNLLGYYERYAPPAGR
jgi:PAS domain-containing protein